MPNHLHFVAGLKAGTISSVMHSLKSFTSNQLKSLLSYEGPIWQSQYHDHATRKDEVLIEVITYCLYNPVRAGLVDDFHDYAHWYCKYEI